MAATNLSGAFAMSNMALLANLDGIDEETSLRLPPEGGNSIHWVLGHIIESRRGLTGLLGGDFPVAADELAAYARGQNGRALASPMPWERLKEHLASSSAALAETLAGVSDEGLAAPHGVDRPPLNRFDDVEGVSTFLLFHEGYHAGQIGILRRAFGIEGRIG